MCVQFVVSNSWTRQSNAFERSVSKTQKICFYQQSTSIFLINSKDNMAYYVLFKIRIVKIRIVGMIKTYQNKLIFTHKVFFLIFQIMLVEY